MPLIIRVCDVLFFLYHSRWFKFLKGPLIPTVDPVLEPPAVDAYWTWTNDLDLILPGFIKGMVFPPLSLFHLFTVRLFLRFHSHRVSILIVSLPSVLLLQRTYGGAVAAPPPTGLLSHRLSLFPPIRYVSASFLFLLRVHRLFLFSNTV